MIKSKEELSKFLEKRLQTGARLVGTMQIDIFFLVCLRELKVIGL